MNGVIKVLLIVILAIVAFWLIVWLIAVESINWNTALQTGHVTHQIAHALLISRYLTSRQ